MTRGIGAVLHATVTAPVLLNFLLRNGNGKVARQGAQVGCVACPVRCRAPGDKETDSAVVCIGFVLLFTLA